MIGKNVVPTLHNLKKSNWLSETDQSTSSKLILIKWTVKRNKLIEDSQAKKLPMEVVPEGYCIDPKYINASYIFLITTEMP